MLNYELKRINNGRNSYYTICTKDYRVATVVYNFLNTFDVLGKLSLLSADDIYGTYTYEFNAKDTTSLEKDLLVLNEVIERILN